MALINQIIHRVNDKCSSPIQTLTVGSGITPDQPFGSRAFTAGTELHLSLKFDFILTHNLFLSIYMLKMCLSICQETRPH